MDIELIDSRTLAQYVPVLTDVDDLGDRFLLSMLHWCGVGKRSTPLQLWRVYLARNRQDAEVVGVCGLYQNPGMPADIGWLSWLGIRRQYRRQGIGSRMIQELVKKAKEDCGFLVVWVYTDPHDAAVHAFYLANGFEQVGLGGEVAPDVVMTAEDVVFRMLLSQPIPGTC